MSEAALLNISVQRNEDYVPHTLKLTDIFEAPIDLTGWSFVFRINDAAGLVGSPDLALSGTPNGNGSYIAVTDAESGELELFIAKEDIAALPKDDSVDFTSFAHNLIGTDGFGYERVVARGEFTAEPGV